MHNVTLRLRNKAARFSGWAGVTAALLVLAAGVIMGAYPDTPGQQYIANEAYTLVLTANPDMTQVAYGESVVFTASLTCNDPFGPTSNAVSVKVYAGKGDDTNGFGSVSTPVKSIEHGPNKIAVTASGGGLSLSRSIDVIRVTVGAGSTDCVHTAEAQIAIDENQSYSPAGYDWTVAPEERLIPLGSLFNYPDEICYYFPRMTEPGIYAVKATSKNLKRCHDETNAVVFKVAITGENGPLLAVGNTAAYTAVVTPELSGTYAWSVTGGGLGIDGPSTDKSVMVTGLVGSASIDAECLKVVFSPPSANCMAETNLTVIKVDINGFSLSPTWARGNGCTEAPHRSTCQGTIQPRGVSTITYSIQGVAHGATIDASTGVVTPGVNDSGTITVRAAATLLPSCVAASNLLIRAIPVGIANTAIATSNLNYGAIYTHTATSSGGSLENVEITEIVTVAQDDFNTGWGGVPEGTITATMDAGGQFNDNIGTPSAFIDANDFLPSPPKAGLPATLNTPQVLEWRCPLDNDWIPFANIAITATLSRQGTNLMFTTTDNGVSCVEPYSGTPVP